MELEHIPTTSVAGIETSCLDRKSLAELVGHLVERYEQSEVKPAPYLIFSSNGQAISLAGSDPSYLDIMQKADLVHADGQSVVTMSRKFSHKPILERSATTDMIHDIPQHYAPVLKHFFLGGTEEVVSKAAEIFQSTYDNAEVCGYRNGYFSEHEEAEIIHEINASNADVLWVGLGKPKEQIFCIRNRDKLNVPVVISCGGCYNFITGHYRRAPQWMQDSGLEWVHRVMLNPKKLFWRYLVTNPHAMYLAYKHRYKALPTTQQSKKVLFLLKTFSGGGGVERVSRNLAHSLKKFGYEPEFYVFFSKQEDVQQLEKEWPVMLVKPEMRTPLGVLKSFWRFRQYVKSNRFQVVISSKETANIISLVALMFLSKTLRVFTRHVAFDASDQKLSPFAIKCLYFAYTLTRSRIVAVSESLADQIKSFLPFSQNKVFARANPVINDDIYQLADTKGQIDSDYICAVGRLCEQKGFDILLYAYQKALKLKPNLPKLVIVGEGEDRAELEALIDKLGLKDKVTLYGFTQNPYAILKQARLFVLPSRHEGLPTVLVEAIALGVPVVASDCETGPRELLEGGRYGGLVPVNNINALADAIVSNLEKPIVPSKQVIEKYQFSNAADGYIQLFH